MEWAKQVVEAIVPSLVVHQGYDAKGPKDLPPAKTFGIWLPEDEGLSISDTLTPVSRCNAKISRRQSFWFSFNDLQLFCQTKAVYFCTTAAWSSFFNDAQFGFGSRGFCFCSPKLVLIVQYFSLGAGVETKSSGCSSVF